MSGLIADLRSMSRSLSAQQTGIETAGKNLANVNNPNYSRQIVNLTSAGMGGTATMGATASSVDQVRSALLDQMVTQESSQTGSLQAQVDHFTTAQTLLGETITSSTSPTSSSATGSGNTGISAGLSSFFNAFSSLSADPSNATKKQLLLQQSSTLVNQINQTDSQLQSLQTGITTQATSDVSAVNGLLQNIATLNGQIAQAGANPTTATLDLKDERQAALLKLASYMDFTTGTATSGNGQIKILSQDASGTPVSLVDGTAVTPGGITFDGTNLTVGTPSTTLALQGGSIYGELSARDGAIQQLRDNIKSTANEMTTAVNAAYNPTGATGNFFQATPTTGIIALDSTLSLSTLKTTDTVNAGANELALAVSDVANKTFSSGSGDAITGTISGFYGQTVSSFGAALSNTQTQLTNQQNVAQMLGTQQSSVSGVSMDEELTNLVQYQKAFQASSQVINVLDSLIDSVLGMVK